MRVRAVLAVTAAAALATPLAALAAGRPADPTGLTTPPARDAEPVVLTGASFGAWTAPANVTVKAPLTDTGAVARCELQGDCTVHNHYAKPEVDTAAVVHAKGTPVDALTGWRWQPHAHRFVQIPLQVDEVFARYLDNSASGFAFYSGEDQHTTYAFDREGFRYTKSDPANPCLAVPDSPVARDPVQGLDTNDEVVFMASDAAAQAPADALLPNGVVGVKQVTVADPATGRRSYVYVMKSGPRGPKPAFTAANGYVHYQRDANADYFEKSESTYSDYGNAAKGVYCTADGQVVINPATGQPDIQRRRPRDTAWVWTDRYRFRYDGRWLMTQLQISPDGGVTYGPDLVDRWKARAFQQDPSSSTPCCGFEEEDTHWGGSSTLLGERCGPVRCIRETWGADSGTNVVRRETFYRDSMVMTTFLRVHPIPPLDGIYAQWDFNAGRMTRFYNPEHPSGVAVDGRNDEVFGNLDDPCNARYDANDTSSLDQGYRHAYRQTGLCDVSPYHQSIDLTDPTFQKYGATLDWTETAGPWGTIVERTSVRLASETPGGLAQGVFAVPYYRDDSCFDDGTGDDPGPRLNPGSSNEPLRTPAGTPRRCWKPSDGIPDPTTAPQFFQGDIGTHGLHLLFVAESDNARQTVPVDEIVSDQQQVFLPGDPGNVGDRYGRDFEKPLVATVQDGA